MTREGKKKILLLDDEKFLLELYKIALEKDGFETHLFYSGYDALAALQSGYVPDAILFDITMPESMSGYEFIDTVNMQKMAPHALKIALTNEAQDAEKIRTGELGVDAHFVKAEFIPSEIARKVRDMLGARDR